MQPLPPAQLRSENRRRIFGLLREKENRAERLRQSNPEGGLLEFIRYFWHVLEPVDPFIEGWTLECLCAHLEAITRGDTITLAGEERTFNRFLCNVPPGFMKACDCDEPVLTTEGWKRHGDLQVGDYVYGPDGLLKKVQGRTPNALEEAYEVKFDDDATVVVGAGHLWAIERDLPNQNESKRGSWKRVPCVVTTPELRAGNKDASRRCADRIVLTKPLAGRNDCLPIDPYVLGAWLGDGDSKQGILYCGEQDFAHFVMLGHEIAGTDTARRVSIPGMTTVLRQLGVFRCKHIPQLYLQASLKDRWALLQGLMDTDGQVSPEGWCRFTSGNERLIKDFVTLACSLGLKVRTGQPFMSEKRERTKRGPYCRVRFTPPVGAQVFRLARKQSRLQREDEIIRGIGHRYVVSVTPVGKRLVNCIQVEEQLYLVTDRYITTHNSLTVNAFWPAWEWGPMGLPHLRYVAFSYASELTERDNAKFRDLVCSDAYKELWGHVFRVIGDPKAGKIRVTNDKTGFKFASSFGGVGTGERGHRVLLDDPHKLKGTQESADARQAVTIWVREAMQNRLNDLSRDAIVVIMQRVHEEDASGAIMKHLGDEYGHLIIPMAFEANRHFSHYKGWNDGEDPRTRDGELAWPERYPPRALMSYKRNDYLWAGQYQQTPIPRGGGIFKDHWWQPYNVPVGGHYEFDDESVISIIASLDTAFKEKEENDYTALTVWAVYDHPKTKQRRVMIIDAWRKRLALHGQYVPRLPEEEPVPGDDAKANNKRELTYLKRAAPKWGLCEWLTYTCSKRKVRRLIIEDSARGHDTAMELQRLFMNDTWTVVLEPVKGGDKWDRAQAVTDVFTDDMVFAPGTWVDGGDGGEQTWMWRDWVQEVILELCSFPRGTHDDYVDSVVQALRYLRRIGLAIRRSERLLLEREMSLYKKPSLPLYPA